MKTFVLLLTSFFVLLSCSNNDDNFTPQNVTPTLIGKGVLYGNGAEGIPQQNVVITSQTQFNDLMNSMDSINGVSNSFTETSIDFNNFMIIGVFDSVKQNGGYDISIINIAENLDNISITIETAYTPIMTAVITQPFHIVKIPKSAKPIVFQ